LVEGVIREKHDESRDKLVSEQQKGKIESIDGATLTWQMHME
jgi:hypothetical protein